jgi:hypothetical protein
MEHLMTGRWRKPALALLLTAAIASGWVYAYLTHRPPLSPRFANSWQEWHGTITTFRDYPPFGRQWLVESPTMADDSPAVDRMWISVPKDKVIDWRTGKPGELAVGQQVAVHYDGIVMTSDPAQCVADSVLIESDGNRDVLTPKVFRGLVTSSADGEWLVEAPSYAKPGATEGIRAQVHLTNIVDWATGQQAKLEIGQRVSVWYQGAPANVDPPKCSADTIVIEPADFASRLRE